MPISITEVQNGMGLVVDGQVYRVVEYHHVKPAKGSAFVRIKLRHLKNESVLERTYRTAEKLEDADLEERKLNYLYAAGDTFHFMDHSTYEEVAVSQELLGDGIKFLKDNLEVTGIFYNDQIQTVSLPNFIIFQITESEAGIRGDSTKSGTKPAKIETGATIQVPLFINAGDWVKIDTRDGGYVERVQK